MHVIRVYTLEITLKDVTTLYHGIPIAKTVVSMKSRMHQILAHFLYDRRIAWVQMSYILTEKAGRIID